MKKHTTHWARFGALALLLLGGGCFGDVQIVDDPVTAAGGSAGTPDVGVDPLTPVRTCELDDVRCEGPDVEHCVAFGAGQSWLKLQHCASAALCNAGSGCTEAACAFGEQRCNGAVPERCNEDQTARDPLAGCPSAAYCSPDAAKCQAENKQAPCCLETPCTAGELRCNSGQLERCRDDQLGLDPVVTCATQKLCELSLGACQSSPASCVCEPPKCEAGATRCTGATLERCNADQTDWEQVDPPCATEELCQSALALGASVCPAPACDVGEHQCTGAALEVCNAGQTDFELVKVCPGGAGFCNAGGGVCTDTPCNVGDLQCNGVRVERCLPDRSGFDPVAADTCDTPQLCSVAQGPAHCEEPKCGVNEFRCEGSQPLRCNAGRTALANAGAACLRPELCDTFRQRCDFCFPSRRECTPNLGSSRTCSPDGTSFGPLTFCPLGCVASTGACQTCQVGEFRCQGGLLSRCNDGVSFTPLNVGAQCAGGNQVSCNGNQVQSAPCGALGCNAQRAACNQCSGQQRDCADTANFRSCQPNGTFGPPTACGNGLLCAGAGQCSCSPGQALCEGNTLRVCSPGGNGLVAGARCSGTGGNVLRTCAAGELTTNTCASAALCTSATGAACSACVEGEGSCAAGQPQVCVNGQRVAATACDAGFSCEGAGLCRCTAGDVRCAAGSLVQCAADRQSLEPAAVCAGATLRSCSGDTRVDQDCGAADLCPAGGGVCARCRGNDPITCADDFTELRCVGGQLRSTPCDAIDLCVPDVGCLSSVLPI
jgi:hypothetical protein